MLSRWLTPILLLGLLASAGCDKLSAKVPSDDRAVRVPAGFVERRGTQLVLDGKPYFFTGINIYNAADNAGTDFRRCWYPMGTGNALATSLRDLGPGKEVIRVWFFQNQAIDDTGHRDWSALDHTLAVAKLFRVRVIPVLADQWGHCEGRPGSSDGYKTEDWYRSGYRARAEPGMTVSYRQYVAEVTTRYRDNPTILAWQLMNEAEDRSRHDGDCRPTATSTLAGFATDMAGLIKSIDPAHLLSLGTIGSGQCGARGDEYRVLHAVPGIDLCEFHDYDPKHPVPGDAFNGMGVRLRQCQALGKPLITGEIGLRNGDGDGTYAGRARVLDGKLRAQRQAGVAGALLWAWRDGPHGGSTPDDYYVGPADPALAVLGRY